MRTRRVIGFLTCFVLQVSVSPSSIGQSTRGFLAGQEIHTGVSYQTWSSERDDRVSEFMAPLLLIIPLGSNLSLDVSTAGGKATLLNPDQSISGITDTRMVLSYTMFDETLLLTAGISAPTGKSQLNDDQNAIAASLSNSALAFQLPTFGQGLDLNVGVVYGLDFKDFVVGMGLGGLIKGKFKPSSSIDADYKPGSEITATIGFDKLFELEDSRFVITGDVSYTYYFADLYDGEQVFRSGNKVSVDLKTHFSVQPFEITLFVQERTKGKNQRGLGTLSPESQNNNGNQVDIGANAGFVLHESMTGILLSDVRIYSRNDLGGMGALVYGAGPGIDWNVSGNLWMNLFGKYYTGELLNPNVTTKIYGFELGLGFRYKI